MRISGTIILEILYISVHILISNRQMSQLLREQLILIYLMLIKIPFFDVIWQQIKQGKTFTYLSLLSCIMTLLLSDSLEDSLIAPKQLAISRS